MYEAIKRQIVQRAARKGISISALGRTAHLPAGTLGNIISGTSTNPTVSVLSAIADALDCSILDLLEKESDLEADNAHNRGDNLLFKSAADLVVNICEEKGICLSSYDLFVVTKEIYYYYLAKNEHDINKPFAEGFINAYLKKSCRYPVYKMKTNSLPIQEKTPTHSH